MYGRCTFSLKFDIIVLSSISYWINDSFYAGIDKRLVLCFEWYLFYKILTCLLLILVYQKHSLVIAMITASAGIANIWINMTDLKFYLYFIKVLLLMQVLLIVCNVQCRFSISLVCRLLLVFVVQAVYWRVVTLSVLCSGRNLRPLVKMV